MMKVFKQLDKLENNILDGQSFEEAAQKANLNVISIKKVNANKENENKVKIENLSEVY